MTMGPGEDFESEPVVLTGAEDLRLREYEIKKLRVPRISIGLVQTLITRIKPICLINSVLMFSVPEDLERDTYLEPSARAEPCPDLKPVDVITTYHLWKSPERFAPLAAETIAQILDRDDLDLIAGFRTGKQVRRDGPIQVALTTLYARG